MVKMKIINNKMNVLLLIVNITLFIILLFILMTNGNDWNTNVINIRNMLEYNMQSFIMYGRECIIISFSAVFAIYFDLI